MTEWHNSRKSLLHRLASPFGSFAILPAGQLYCEAYVVRDTAVNDVSPRFFQDNVEPSHDLSC